MRRLALVLVWTLPSATFVMITALVYDRYRIAPPARLDASERAAVLAPLRAALDDRAQPCELHRPGGAVAVTVWLDGHSVARADGHGGDLAAAVDDAARQLRGRVTDAAARIQVDVIGARGKLGGLAVPGVGEIYAVNPGIDGVGTDIGSGALILPHELIGGKLLAASAPSDAMPELAMGLDLVRLASTIAQRTGVRIVPTASLFRFRSDAFVEQTLATRDRPPLQLSRGVPAAPPPTAEALREAALAGGRYLVAHLSPSGRFVYEHDLATGVRTNPLAGAYAMPRHAGTTYFLAQLYRITQEPWLREPIERANAHLASLLAAGHCGDGAAYDCVLDRGEKQAHLGSTALAVVALVEYQRATGDARYLPLARQLTEFVLRMQRADGSFRHLFDPRTKQPDDTSELLYYSGEAALALARMYEITQEPRYATAAERGLDWLVDWYDFFIGGFLYGEEHWTCIAAEAIWPAVKKPKYRAFCDGYAAFLRAQQPAVGEHPDEDDLAGAYTVTPFVVPYNTPVGSRTEAMISTYLLDLHHGAADPATAAQIRAALGYMLAQQLRPDSDFAVIGDADGGVPGSLVERNVRIDYVQHVCSAMIRASVEMRD